MAPVLPNGGKGREAVLALPLNRMLVRMARVPSGEDPVAVAAPILQASNPFPDEQLTVSCETVGETEASDATSTDLPNATMMNIEEESKK